MVLHAVSMMDPPITNHSSLFEIGCGVGAALVVLTNVHPGIRVAGSDFTAAQVELAKRALPDASPFMLHDMTARHPGIADETYDHVSRTL